MDWMFVIAMIALIVGALSIDDAMSKGLPLPSVIVSTGVATPHPGVQHRQPVRN